jgi:glycosyltransferase involved in cell wall biosynthesis
MKLLILTQYYPPEIGAPQNRLHELAIRLKKKGVHVEVLTAMPNYPTNEIHEAYKNNAITEEIIDEIIVHRAKIYVSKSKSIVSRLLNYFSFVYTSWRRGRKLPHFDFLMVESPPLFLGYSAMRLSKKLNAKLIFNVSDLWPESAEKLGLVTNKTLLNFAYKLEKKCYYKSSLVTGQTQGITTDITKRFPDVNTYWLPNGVDLSFYNPQEIKEEDFRTKNNFQKDDILFFYGGIIGYAQGLDIILQAAKEIKNPKVKFILQGAGPEKERLIDLKKNMSLSNVFFLNPVEKKQMPGILKNIDAAIIPLKKLAIFEGAIPSKVFETLAMEVPILLCVDGEAREHFVEKAKAAFFIEPENTNQLIDKINFIVENPLERVEMGKRGRIYAMEVFNRDKIAEGLLQKLKEI